MGATVVIRICVSAGQTGTTGAKGATGQTGVLRSLLRMILRLPSSALCTFVASIIPHTRMMLPCEMQTHDSVFLMTAGLTGATGITGNTGFTGMPLPRIIYMLSQIHTCRRVSLMRSLLRSP